MINQPVCLQLIYNKAARQLSGCNISRLFAHYFQDQEVWAAIVQDKVCHARYLAYQRIIRLFSLKVTTEAQLTQDLKTADITVLSDILVEVLVSGELALLKFYFNYFRGLLD
jgi:hypothetical protein